MKSRTGNYGWSPRRTSILSRSKPEAENSTAARVTAPERPPYSGQYEPGHFHAELCCESIQERQHYGFNGRTGISDPRAQR